MIAAAIAVAVAGLMALLVASQFLLRYSASTALDGKLGPAIDTAATLTLEQSTADAALSDYVELERPKSLDAYRQTIGRATTILDELGATVSDDAPDLQPLLDEARATQRSWVRSQAEPLITLMEAGKRGKALRESGSQDAAESVAAMTAASSELRAALNAARGDAQSSVSAYGRLLTILIIVGFLLVVAGSVACVVGLRAWVLDPLERIDTDIRRATDDHASPVRPDGPPELRAVAMDAELLRRGLVHEVEAAEAAREGLVQDAPLVAAMRGELLGHPVSSVGDLVISGSSQPAEGVVAGDWWDAFERPDGSAAIVVADVSGHGPEASVSALRVRSVLRTALLSGLSASEATSWAARACVDDSHVVTLIVVIADSSRNELSWCNAGHHPAIVVTRDKEASLCEPTGPLVSSLGGEWTVGTRPFHPGDVVVTFTDGLVESRNADGDELESSQVSLILRGMDAPLRENPEELIDRLLGQVRHRAADWRRDDVTVVAMARRT